MSSFEPPVPAAAAHGFAADGASGTASERPPSLESTAGASKRWTKWRRVVGLLLLAVTVILWTASNFLASTIFADNTYSKPYLVTYVNTSFFIIPLVPMLVRKALQHPGELRHWRDDWRQKLRQQYTPLKHEEDADDSAYTDIPRDRRRRESMNASQELLLGEQMENSQILSFRNAPADDAVPLPPLRLSEIAKLSLEFCLLWFAANYCVAACLEYTTVASSTILTSTSSAFTLIFGSLFGVESFSLRKVMAVLASLAGIILISSMDLSGNNSDDEHRGDFPQKSLRDIAIGDALAFFSAILYGLYAAFMKKRIGDESRVNMLIFFGLVGLINVVLLWPGLLILHFTGLERFELPPTSRVTAIILTNSVCSLVSDLAWAYAVLLTSPIVVTVGLSMTIPLSLVGQSVLNSQTASPVYWVGALLVVLSFVFVSQDEKKAEIASFPHDAEQATVIDES
ncbi:hypothetical protein LTR36_008380 [Oleoguttula mirabilis]|uniref:EamA domain-containing protein n=1 Tax=Oleoguttula mirabilis TaxID=1507867 RepID=A0AAV9J7F9_9PEZI|nr:hypothetical protein LTR36_008380 [Oleoguttula mirabilis]